MADLFRVLRRLKSDAWKNGSVRNAVPRALLAKKQTNMPKMLGRQGVVRAREEYKYTSNQKNIKKKKKNWQAESHLFPSCLTGLFGWCFFSCQGPALTGAFFKDLPISSRTVRGLEAWPRN